MRIAVLMPSRGLQASRMLEAVGTAIRGYAHSYLWTHDLPLPACFNDLVTRMLRENFTHGWFVEEDVVVPSDAVRRMLETGADIAAVNYPIRCVRKDGRVPLSSYYFQGRLLWLSLGCTLVRRGVFEKLKAPWFVTDTHIVAINDMSKGDWRLETRPRPPEDYGGQDSAFCFRATQEGFTLGEAADTLATHLPSIGPEEEAA